MVQCAGAVGVIVVNREGEKNLANMKPNDSKENLFLVKIATALISYDDWLEILPCRNDTDVMFTDKGEATFDMDHGREALDHVSSYIFPVCLLLFGVLQYVSKRVEILFLLRLITLYFLLIVFGVIK